MQRITQKMPECLTNDQIRRNGDDLIHQMHGYIKTMKMRGDANVDPLLEELEDIRSAAKKGKEMNPERFRKTLNVFQAVLEDKIDEHVEDKEVAEEDKAEMDEIVSQLDDFKKAVRANSPVQGVLQNDMEDLVTVL